MSGDGEKEEEGKAYNCAGCGLRVDSARGVECACTSPEVARAQTAELLEKAMAAADRAKAAAVYAWGFWCSSGTDVANVPSDVRRGMAEAAAHVRDECAALTAAGARADRAMARSLRHSWLLVWPDCPCGCGWDSHVLGEGCTSQHGSGDYQAADGSCTCPEDPPPTTKATIILEGGPAAPMCKDDPRRRARA